MLDAYEKALAPGVVAKDLRLRIEHAQILTPEDIERAGRLGVISSVQPTHGERRDAEGSFRDHS